MGSSTGKLRARSAAIMKQHVADVREQTQPRVKPLAERLAKWRVAARVRADECLRALPPDSTRWDKIDWLESHYGASAEPSMDIRAHLQTQEAKAEAKEEDDEDDEEEEEDEIPLEAEMPLGDEITDEWSDEDDPDLTPPRHRHLWQEDMPADTAGSGDDEHGDTSPIDEEGWSDEEDPYLTPPRPCNEDEDGGGSPVI